MKDMWDSYVDRLIQERMEFHYDAGKGEAASGWEPCQPVEEMEKAYQEILERLPREEKQAIQAYVDRIASSLSAEANFYYRAGVKDGYGLHSRIRKWKKQFKNR